MRLPAYLTRPVDIKKSVANLDPDDKKEVAKAAVTAVPKEDKKEVANAAVTAVPEEDKKEVAKAAVQHLNLKDQEDLVDSLESAQKMIWQMMAWGLIIIGAVTGLTLTMGALGQLSSVQELVTIATSIFAAFAGYSLGKAHLWRQRLLKLIRQGLWSREKQEVKQ